MKLNLIKLSKQTIIAIVVSALICIFFVYRWHSIKSSNSFEHAIDFILNKIPDINRDEINLQSYKLSSSSDGRITHFEFELGEDAFMAIRVEEKLGKFTVVEVPVKIEK